MNFYSCDFYGAIEFEWHYVWPKGDPMFTEWLGMDNKCRLYVTWSVTIRALTYLAQCVMPMLLFCYVPSWIHNSSWTLILALFSYFESVAISRKSELEIEKTGQVYFHKHKYELRWCFFLSVIADVVQRQSSNLKHVGIIISFEKRFA